MIENKYDKQKRIIYNVLLSILLIFTLVSIPMLASGGTEDIFEENIPKVVEIKVTDDESTWGYATGFFVDNDGTILTNRHVVLNSKTNEYYKQIWVATAFDEDFVEAKVIKVSETDDLALIKVDYEKTQHFKFATSVLNGETIYTIGNPSGFGLSFTQGVVSSNSRNVVHDGKTINCIQASFVINEGNSGGPVFNAWGELVGIVSFRLKDNKNEVIQGCTFVIPTETIKDFIS